MVRSQLRQVVDRARSDCHGKCVAARKYLLEFFNLLVIGRQMGFVEDKRLQAGVAGAAEAIDHVPAGGTKSVCVRHDPRRTLREQRGEMIGRGMAHAALDAEHDAYSRTAFTDRRRSASSLASESFSVQMSFDAALVDLLFYDLQFIVIAPAPVKRPASLVCNGLFIMSAT